ncbi:MAG: glycoside hydrolase family 25 protein [Aureispira sp.]
MWKLLKTWHQLNLRFYLYPIYLVLLFFLSTLLQHDAHQYTVQGVDVSRYQRQIDWEVLHQEAGVQFAFMKATEGSSYEDPYFDYNWKTARKVGVLRGAYHFYRTEQSPLWQAKQFMRTVKLRKGDLPPVLDVENVDKVNKADLIKDLTVWLETVEEHYKIRPIIYASLDLYQRHLHAAFPDHLVWIARYSRRQPPLELNWYFWQYSDEMELSGIKGYVDGNVFVGSYRQLKQICL